jgi:hypothetical protein
MDEQQDPQPEQQDVEKWYTPLTRTTPLSRYLALVIFVVLPFVGFWLGVEHSEQFREFETSMTVSEVPTLSSLEKGNLADNATTTSLYSASSDSVWTLYINEKAGYAIEYPPDWSIAEKGDVVELRYSEKDSSDNFGEDAFMQVLVHHDRNGESIIDWYESNKERLNADLLFCEDSYPGGREAVQCFPSQGLGAGIETHVSFANGAHDRIEFTFLTNQDTYSPIYERIIRLFLTPPGDRVGQIRRVFSENDTLVLEFDEIQFKKGPRDDCYALNGYCIEDHENTTELLLVETDTRVTSWHNCNEGDGEPEVMNDAMGVNTRCSNKIDDTFALDESIYWIVTNEDGHVTRIVEQYIP